MNKKKEKQKGKTRVRRCLRCDKLVELLIGFFMCPSCRTIAGNDSVTELNVGIRKK